MLNLRAMLLREWDLFFQSKLDVWFSLFPPIVYVLFFSFNMSGLVGDIQGVQYVHFVLPGIAVMTVLTNASNAGSRTFNEGFSPTLRNLFTLPTTRSTYVNAKLLSTTGVAVAQGSLFLLVGFLLLRMPLHPSALIGVVLAITLTGLAVTGISLTEALLSNPRQMSTYLVVSNVSMQVLIWTSSIFYPLASMPTVLRWISLINPVTYGAEALRGALLGISSETLPSLLAWAGLTAFAAVFSLLSIILLKDRAGRVL